MSLFLTIIFFVFGLIIGSFLNVVILRYNTQKNFGGRSGCMSCSKKLKWYELVPVFSFLCLRGKCSGCKTDISIQYPLVEMVTGIVFASVFFKFKNLFFLDNLNFIISYTYFVSLFSILIVISGYDIRHKIIPDLLVLILGIFSFFGLFLFSSSNFENGMYLHIPSYLDILSGLIISLPFASIWFFSKGKWMGLGDAKLLIGLGWMMGIKTILSGVALGFWIGSIFGIFKMLYSKKFNLKMEIPFGPFLALGAFLAFIFNVNLFLI